MFNRRIAILVSSSTVSLIGFVVLATLGVPVLLVALLLGWTSWESSRRAAGVEAVGPVECSLIEQALQAADRARLAGDLAAHRAAIDQIATRLAGQPSAPCLRPTQIAVDDRLRLIRAEVLLEAPLATSACAAESEKINAALVDLRVTSNIPASLVPALEKRGEVLDRCAEREAKEALDQARLLQRCGPLPTPNETLFRVEMALRVTAHDPDSISVSTCTAPTMNLSHCWEVVCLVRGRNTFGALIAKETKMVLSRELTMEKPR